VLQVLVDGGDGREAKMGGNLLEAGCVPMVLEKLADVVVDLALALGQAHPSLLSEAITYRVRLLAPASAAGPAAEKVPET
jgi:hypothetical protein